MQRWGREQGPPGSVLLRTGALMSLASLGTAGLVLCGALAVGGPGAGDLPSALGNGPASIALDDAERSAVLAAPAGRRPTAGPPPARPTGGADRPDGEVSSLLTVSPVALSGTVASAAQVQLDTDLDSVVHPARDRVVTPEAPRTPSPSAPVSARPVPVPEPSDSAAHGAPARPAAKGAAGAQAPTAEAPRAAKAPRATAPTAKTPRAKAPRAKAPKAKAPGEAAKTAAPTAPKAPKAAEPAAPPPAAAAPPAVTVPPKPAKPAKPAKTRPAPPVEQPAAAADPPTPAPDEDRSAAPQHAGGGHVDHPKGEPPGQAKGSGSSGH